MSEPAEPAPPRLYADLAGWYHLLTAPADYAEEAEIYLEKPFTPPRPS